MQPRRGKNSGGKAAKRKKTFSKQRKNTNSKNDNITEESLNDNRFSKVWNDPRYVTLPKRKRDTNKVKIDERFSAMFNDSAFKSNYRIDRYGREVTDDKAMDLSHFYELNDSNDDNDDADNKAVNDGPKATEKESSFIGNDDGYEEDNESTDTETTKAKSKKLQNKSKPNPKQKPKPKPKSKSKPSQSTENKLSKGQKRVLKEMRADEAGEIKSDDEFWSFWDKEQKAARNEARNEADNSGADEAQLEANELMQRQAGEMFTYAPDSTSESDGSRSDGNYNELTPYDIGDDARALLDTANVPDCDPTNRLAIVNLDWDNIRAQDLYVVFRSFLPPEGSITSVAIHPSEFGMKEMKLEDMRGPDPNIWRKEDEEAEGKQQPDADETSLFVSEQPGEDDNDSEMDEQDRRYQEKIMKLKELEENIEAIKKGQAGDVLGDEKDEIFNKNKLRKYELSKLKYFYAVVECDSKDTADRLYQECDSREFRFTANVLDARFIPDDFTPPYPPRDQCMDVPESYTPASQNATNCLGSTFVDLTWDKSDPNRMETTQRTFNESQMMKMDLDTYLASDGNITDAGFDTDAPVTDYDTDTPDKKVIVKRKARARYKDILDDLKTQMDGLPGSSDESSNDNNTNGDGTGIEDMWNEGSSSSSADDSGDDNTDKSKLDDWISKQKEYLKKDLIAAGKPKQAQQLMATAAAAAAAEEDTKEEPTLMDELSAESDSEEMSPSRKRNRDEFEMEATLTDDDETDNLDFYANVEDSGDDLISDGELPPDLKNDPYFAEELNSTQPPPKKKRKLNDNTASSTTATTTATVEVKSEAEKRAEMRAKLELLMMTDEKDPEDTELDMAQLSQSFDNRLKKNWRLRLAVKKAVKKKLKEMEPFRFNADDRRFTDMYQNPDFAIDPTNTSFRRTDATQHILQKTRANRLERANTAAIVSKAKSGRVDNDSTLETMVGKSDDNGDAINTSALVKSLKKKAKQIPSLKDGQTKRKNITKKLKAKGLSSY